MTKMSRKQRILNALIFAAVFIAIPLLISASIDRYAPASYFIKFNEITVGDMQYGTWNQNVTIERRVRKNLQGKPRQELILFEPDTNAPTEKVAETDEPKNPVLYEVTETGSVSFINDWSKKIPIEKLNTLQVGKEYYWLWIVEVQITPTRTETFYVKTNKFKILPPASVIEINNPDIIINK